MLPPPLLFQLTPLKSSLSISLYRGKLSKVIATTISCPFDKIKKQHQNAILRPPERNNPPNL